MKRELNQIVATLLFVAIFSMSIVAAPTGVQAFGFSNFESNNANILADEFVSASVTSKELEISVLPFTFNPNNPFGRVDAFAKNVIPRLSSGAFLRITVYAWFDEWDGNFDFRNFSNKSSLLNRVRTFDIWAKNLRNWASDRGYSSRLSIYLVPILEDLAPSSSAYSQLLNFIAQQQQADGISTAFRRSPDPANVSFRVGNLPHEYHGKFSSIRGLFRAFDKWSNDGCFVRLSFENANSASSFCTPPMLFSEFLSSQRTALSQSVGSSFWRHAFNGLTQYSRLTPPRQRVNIAPFTGINGNFERDAVRQALRTR